MTKASIDLQDLRRRIYVKAKAEPSWRFWGLYVHVCKVETLRAAYEMAKQNDGAPGVDGVTFEAIEAQGAEALLEQLRDELTGRTYKPLPARKQEIPKDGGKVRVLSIPAIRDRVVQGALKLILEPVFVPLFHRDPSVRVAPPVASVAAWKATTTAKRTQHRVGCGDEPRMVTTQGPRRSKTPKATGRSRYARLCRPAGV